MYKPCHLIGLELAITVASIGLRGEPTGCATGFRGDAVAVAKRDLKAGEALGGEGGYTVYGKLLPAAASLARQGLPIGLAHGVTLKHAVDAGNLVTWNDVATPDAEAVRIRRKERRPGSTNGKRLTIRRGS
jgi:predicted homoserine dehydrogenase-like protein